MHIHRAHTEDHMRVTKKAANHKCVKLKYRGC